MDGIAEILQGPVGWPNRFQVEQVAMVKSEAFPQSHSMQLVRINPAYRNGNFYLHCKKDVGWTA